MMSQKLRILAAATILVGLVTGAQAGDPKRAEGYLNDARKALEKGDSKTAMIQLKNAVQADPDSGLARYELGVVELRLGDYLSAEKELRAAIDRNFDRDKVSVPLAETLLRLHKEQELLDQIPAGDRPADIEGGVRVARGYALLALRRTEDAKKSFQDALARSTKPGAALLGLARAYGGEGKVPEALDWTQKAIDSEPNYVEAYVLLGRLKRIQGDNAASRAAFDKALSLNPNYESGRLERAALLIATNEIDLAQADLKAVQKNNPKQPVAIYYQAVIQAKQKDYRGAEASLQNLKGFIDTYPPALFLLANVHFAQDQLAQAEDNINKYLARVPNDESGTILLASMLSRRGNTQRAMEVLEGALNAHPQSLRLMSVLSEAYARNRQPEKAAALLNKVAAENPDNADLRTRVGAQLLRIGRPGEALADLESATELAPKSEEAGLLLVLTLLQTNKIDEASKAAEALRDRIPGDPVPENLLGAISLRRGDLEGGKAHFEKALEIKPDFNPAAMNLAQLAVVQRRFDDGQAIYEKILQREPSNLDALIGLSDLYSAQGKTNDALLTLEKARNANATATQPRLRLIDAYIKAKDPAKAVAVAGDLDKIAPNDPLAINAIGEAKLANNDTAGAVQAFQHLTVVSPNSATALLQLARAHYAAKDMESVRTDLEKAVELNPTDSRVEQQFIRFTIETNSVAKELAFLQGFAAKRTDDPTFDLLSGDLLMASNSAKEAAAAYRVALNKREDNAAAAIKLAEATAKDDPGKGIDVLAGWTPKHPDQVGARLILGGMYIATKRYDEAIKEHESILDAQPNNPAAANNLAWLYQQKNDDRALPMAERAYKMAPNSLELADTLGWILVQKGQNERGLDLLTQAARVEAAPPEVRYHLAVAQKNAGKLDDARQTLEQALKTSQNFDGANEARDLLKQLSGGG